MLFSLDTISNTIIIKLISVVKLFITAKKKLIIYATNYIMLYIIIDLDSEQSNEYNVF